MIMAGEGKHAGADGDLDVVVVGGGGGDPTTPPAAERRCLSQADMFLLILLLITRSLHFQKFQRYLCDFAYCSSLICNFGIWILLVGWAMQPHFSDPGLFDVF
jgi:hypothetical protein